MKLLIALITVLTVLSSVASLPILSSVASLPILSSVASLPAVSSVASPTLAAFDMTTVTVVSIAPHTRTRTVYGTLGNPYPTPPPIPSPSGPHHNAPPNAPPPPPPPSPAVILPRDPKRGPITKLIDHVLDRIGHRLDKMTKMSSDGRVTIHAPQCIGIGISACNPVHVGDYNRAENGRAGKGGDGYFQPQVGGEGGEGEMQATWGETDGSGGERYEMQGGTEQPGTEQPGTEQPGGGNAILADGGQGWKERKKEWKTNKKNAIKEFKQTVKDARKKSKDEGSKTHQWTGHWGFGGDSDGAGGSSGGQQGGNPDEPGEWVLEELVLEQMDDQGNWHPVSDINGNPVVDDNGGQPVMDDTRGQQEASRTDSGTDADKVDWSWGDDGKEFHPDKAGWANLAVAGHR